MAWEDLLQRPGQSNGLAEFLLNARQMNDQHALAAPQLQLANAQAQEATTKAARDQQFQGDWAQYQKNPTPQALLNLQGKYPEKAQGLSKIYDAKDTAARTSDLGFFGSLYSSLKPDKTGKLTLGTDGKPLAATVLSQRIAADKAAGLDTSEEEQYLQLIQGGDANAANALRGLVLPHLAAAAGPDKFASTFGVVTKPEEGFTLVPGAKRYDSSGNVVATAPFAPQYRTVNGTDENGNPITSIVRVGGSAEGGGPTSGAPGGARSAPGVPMTVGGLKPLFSAQESGGNYTAVNKETGALGRYQVMPATGASLAQKAGLPWRPELMKSATPEAKQYQDAIGNAAIQDAIDSSGGNLANAFGYYYSGTTDRSKWGPKTKRYVTQMMGRANVAQPQNDNGQDTSGNGQVVYSQRGQNKGVPAPLGDPSLSGESYLNSLPANQREAVRAIAEGRVTPPRAGTRNGEAMLDAVTRYDPTFDAANAATRIKTRVDFTTGKSAQSLNAINTVMGHMNDLDHAIDDLHNYDQPWLNSLTGSIAYGAGDTRYQTSLKSFNAAKNAVSRELTRAYRGSGGNVADIKDFDADLSASDSPAALHATIKKYVQLLGSKIQALGDTYNQGLGQSRDPITLLNSKAASTYSRLSGEGPPETNTSGRTPPSAPSSGWGKATRVR